MHATHWCRTWQNRLGGSNLPRILTLMIAMWIATTGAFAQSPAGQPLRDLLQQARALAEAHRTQEAHALLEGAEDEFIGLAEFDYQLGRAALAAGRPDRATLAFTRVLAREPNHAGALIDMGRAFVALGNLEQARAQFNAVLALGPPPEIRAQVERDLRSFAAKDPGLRVTRSGFLRLALGHDDNVNQSGGQTQVFVPLFGQTFALDARNVRARDRFTAVSAGFELFAAPELGWGWSAAADVLERWNHNRAEFDLGGIGGRIGPLWRGSQDIVRVQAVTSRTYIDGLASRKFAGLAGEWLMGERSANQWLATALQGRLRHPAAGLAVFDVDLAAAGLTRIWLRADGGSLAAGVAGGKDTAIAAHPSGSKRYLGVRLAAIQPIAARWRVEAAAAAQSSRYDRVDAAFLTVRSDRRADMDLALRWQAAEEWSVRAAITWTRFDSNVPVYAYTRREYSISLQKDFK